MLSLSQWPKRDDLYKHLDSLLSTSADPLALTALLIINLDNFRDSCELFEYRDIEEFLAIVGQSIKDACPESSYIAWLGSDEFAVVPALQAAAEVKETAETICQKLAEAKEFGTAGAHHRKSGIRTVSLRCPGSL